MPTSSTPLARHDAETMVSSRLKEPWSAVAFASTCKEEVLRTVQGRYHDLEQHVRLRILLAALALRKGPAQAMAPLLGRMAEDAQIDEDDWVQVFGHAVGDFTSPLWLSRVAENVPSVCARLFSHPLSCLLPPPAAPHSRVRRPKPQKLSGVGCYFLRRVL